MKVKVHITLKTGVLDPQGTAIQHALGSLGFAGVDRVRQGKYLELDLTEHDPEAALAQARTMCERLLANTVIENYSVALA